MQMAITMREKVLELESPQKNCNVAENDLSAFGFLLG